MSAGTRIPLADAQEIAGEVVRLLAPTSERIEIAGSIRRERQTVGDIEIVAIPRYGEPIRDLFGEVIEDGKDRLHSQCLAHLGYGSFRPRLNALGRKSIGPRLKWMTYTTGRWDNPDVALDVYACTPEQWGVTMAIRTGDADFSRLLVTSKAQGGLCPSHLQFQGWRVVHRDTGVGMDTPEEADLFRALGLDWIEPKDRSAAVQS